MGSQPGLPPQVAVELLFLVYGANLSGDTVDNLVTYPQGDVNNFPNLCSHMWGVITGLCL